MAKAKKQTCFLGEDGYMYCNAVYRDGELVWTQSGKWFRFWPRQRRRRAKS